MISTENTPLESERLILSADDFGLNQSATQRILEGAQHGLIDRVAVVVDGIESQQERDALLQTGSAIDLHLQLPGFSVQEESQNRSKGALRRLFLFFVRVIGWRYGNAVVTQAWQEQIEQFQQKYGRMPDGLNSHQHVHFYPPFFRIAAALCQRYQISYIRLGKKNLPPATMIARILNGCRRFDRRWLPSSAITSDTLVSLDWLDGLKLPPAAAGSLEVVVHPEREEEYRALSALRTSCRPVGVNHKRR